MSDVSELMLSDIYAFRRYLDGTEGFAVWRQCWSFVAVRFVAPAGLTRNVVLENLKTILKSAVCLIHHILGQSRARMQSLVRIKTMGYICTFMVHQIFVVFCRLSLLLPYPIGCVLYVIVLHPKYYSNWVYRQTDRFFERRDSPAGQILIACPCGQILQSSDELCRFNWHSSWISAIHCTGFSRLNSVSNIKLSLAFTIIMLSTQSKRTCTKLATHLHRF